MSKTMNSPFERDGKWDIWSSNVESEASIKLSMVPASALEWFRFVVLDILIRSHFSTKEQSFASWWVSTNNFFVDSSATLVLEIAAPSNVVPIVENDASIKLSIAPASALEWFRFVLCDILIRSQLSTKEHSFASWWVSSNTFVDSSPASVPEIAEPPNVAPTVEIEASIMLSKAPGKEVRSSWFVLSDASCSSGNFSSELLPISETSASLTVVSTAKINTS